MSTTLASEQIVTHEQPVAADFVVPVEVHSSLVPGTATQVDVRTPGHRFTIDEPAGLGGTDLGANPVEHLFAALGGCTVITFQVWADKLALRLTGVDVSVRGDLDTRGFFGLDASVRPGFAELELVITLTGPESAADYARLADAVEEHCPVLDNLAPGAQIRRTVNFTSAA